LLLYTICPIIVSLGIGLITLWRWVRTRDQKEKAAKVLARGMSKYADTQICG
jgi:hypothetical protein